MTTVRSARLAALAVLGVALVGLWQAWPLERWSFDGPGAGFFPQAVALACALLAAVVFAWPGRPAAGADGDDEADAASASIETNGANGTSDASPIPGSRRDPTLAIYALALVVMALGAMFAGFALTAIATTVIVMRFAERRGWLASLGFGVACALAGLLVFGGLLRVDLPQRALDEAVLAFVRR